MNQSNPNILDRSTAERPPFTPGPWSYHREPELHYRIGTRKRDGHDTATVQVVFREANARLVAKTPELYDLLAWIVSYYSEPWFADQEDQKAREATGGEVSAMEARIKTARVTLGQAIGKDICPDCGGEIPAGQSCMCFDNNCQ